MKGTLRERETHYSPGPCVLVCVGVSMESRRYDTSPLWNIVSNLFHEEGGFLVCVWSGGEMVPWVVFDNFA